MSILTSIRNTLLVNPLSLCRSLLALSTLSLLLINNTDTLFYTDSPHFSIELIKNTYIFKYSIFELFGEYIIEAKILSCIILFSVISGYFPQITCILHWWVSYSFFLSSPFVDGGDQLASILTLFLIPIYITDRRINHWDMAFSNSNSFIKTAGLAIIRVQIAIVYFQAAVAKFKVDEWVDGTAVYYWFNHGTHGMPDHFKTILHPLITNGYTVSLMTYGAILLELTLFSCIFINRKANWSLWLKYIFFLAVLFHFSIFAIQGLFSFSLIMLSALIMYLYPINLQYG